MGTHDLPALLIALLALGAVAGIGLSDEPKVLVAHQPTRGLDVGAIEYIGERLLAAAASGIGVLLLSTDLGEIAALADRIVVVYRGRVIGEMSRAEMDMERLGLLIGGSSEGEVHLDEVHYRGGSR